jgi:uncharacterized membrane protein YcaP (DUF421 family)
MNLSQQLRSTPVIVRFCLRLIILVVFAAFAGIGFGKSFAALLWVSVILSAVVGAIKREPAFGADLNYWDETIAYAALFALVTNFNHAVPV